MRLPFRILAACLSLAAIMVFIKFWFNWFMGTPIAASIYQQILVIIGAPLMVFWYGVPAIWGDYPNWCKTFVPKYLQELMKTESKVVFSDWPWKRNPEVLEKQKSDCNKT